MESLSDPVEDILQEYERIGTVEVISPEDLREAEKDINDKMAAFSREMKYYFAQSIESGRGCLLG